jgi:PQQ-like domain
MDARQPTSVDHGRRGLRPRFLAVAALALVVLVSAAMLAGPAAAAGGMFNRNGNVLIADQFNNRVIEVARDGHIVWHFGTGSFVAGPKTVVAPNDAQRVPGGLTLIAGSGAPAGAPGYPSGGASDSRVLLVNQAGKIVWQYGKAGVPGAGPNRLNTPVQATYLPGGNVLITDQANARVIEVTPGKRIVWQYGMTGKPGSSHDRLNNPNSAELLANGHILIADEGNNRVIEVTADKKIVWSYGSPAGSQLNAPAFASRLPNGHTLIADGGNNRVVAVNAAGKVVWSYTTNARPGSVADPAPSQAVRLRGGDTLISDQNNDQVIRVDHSGAIDWSYGQIGVAGHGPGQLNAPYGAKVIGDYTGLTPPTM